jgi:hypothetical protein
MPQPLASRLTCESAVEGRSVSTPATGGRLIGTWRSTAMSSGNSTFNAFGPEASSTMRILPVAVPRFIGM